MAGEVLGDSLRVAAGDSTRGNSVRMPRARSHASNGPMMPPSCARSVRMRCHSGESSRVTSAPAITSEWPLRYFVAECMTRSAPSASGWVSTGVADRRVDGERARRARARSRATAAMSVIVHSGLAGVSIHTSFVSPGRIAARDRIEIGHVDDVDLQPPLRARSRCSQLRSDQYITFGDHHVIARCERLEHRGRRRHARSEQQRRGPPSSAASIASAWSNVGLSARA